MKDFFTILTEKTQDFGSHYRRHLEVVKRFYEALLEKIEVNKRREFVHFLHPSENFARELQIISEVGVDTEEKLKFMGTYTALHLLWMNRHLIDNLKMELLSSQKDRMEIYKNFMRDAGNRFRGLTAVYLEELLKILLPGKNALKFVIMGVGTKSDQDDIDIGIIDDGSKGRDRFNRIIGRIGTEILRYITSFHFHLSEHIGPAHYSASINEYKMVLKKELRDFVIINEMLGAAIITGNEKLFQQFQEEVIARYFYKRKRDNIYHEGYLRGILGEVRALLAKPTSKSHINFKEDGLRPIKSIISAKKVVFNIWKVNAWDIISELRKFDSKRTQEYDILEKSLTFIEIFRYLYQLLVAQDEEIVVDDFFLKNIRKIAILLGYTDFGLCNAETHLLVHYFEHLMNIHRVIPVLLDDLKAHLKKTSIFTPLFSSDYQGNLVVDFIEKFKFFKGASFWDDILEDFRSEEILNKFAADFVKLIPRGQKKIIQKYIGWLKYDLYTLVSFIVTLGENKKSLMIYNGLNGQFLKIISRFPDTVRNLAFVYLRYPQLVNRLFFLENFENLKKFQKIFNSRTFEEETLPVIKGLKNLIEIHLKSSQFFKRYIKRITERYPECLRFLNNQAVLKEFALGIYSDISSMRTHREKKEKLGDYYDLEMLRVSLATLEGVPTQLTNAEFIEFSDQYIRTLYDLCREEADVELNKRMITEDVLAIFATGGLAREQAFDDDYDLIVLLNSEDTELVSYSNRVISKMNAEIIKRGIIPHHRFSEYLGRYIITIKEMEKILSADKPDIFIEQSQILDARLIAGSRRFEKEFFKIIIKPLIFDKKERYIKQMVEELNSRHAIDSDLIDSGIDIKECSGGLRDIEMIMLLLKAKFEITQPVNLLLFEKLSEKIPEASNNLGILLENFNFLKNMRDIYRLAVGATDVISLDGLKILASTTGIDNNAQKLHKRFIKIRYRTRRIVKDLLNIVSHNP